jgi:hypothetical protein
VAGFAYIHNFVLGKKRRYDMKMMMPFLLMAIVYASGFAQEAIIRDMTGTVELKAPGSAVWTPAAPGAVLARNTAISTGFKSTAVLLVGNSTLTVRPLTRLTLEELTRSQGDEQVSLHIQTGRIRAEVTPPAGGKINFAVRSPSATASVRGTTFDFDTINLDVDNGTVQYSGVDGRSVMVYAGGSSTIDSVSGRAAEPQETAAAEQIPTLPPGAESGIPYVPNDIVVGSGGVDYTLTITYE